MKYLLTADLKTRNLIDASRRKVWRNGPNADVLLATEEEVKKLVENVLTTKVLCLQMEYMGTRRTKITVHGVPFNIILDHVEAVFANFSQVGDVTYVLNKAGMATGDLDLQVTLNRKRFLDVPDSLVCKCI